MHAKRPIDLQEFSWTLTSHVGVKNQMLNEILVSAAFRREIENSLFSDNKEEE